VAPPPAGRAVLYISNWSLTSPLCESQTLSYLRALAARGYRSCLVTLERVPYALTPDQAAAATARLAADGICWHPVRYRHRAGFAQAVAGAVAAFVRAASAVARHRPRIVHTRTSAAAAVGCVVARVFGRPLLYDADSELSEEYVDGGHWTRDGLQYRLLAGVEAFCRRHASGIVVLSERLRADFLARGVRAPVTVIPCCVDLRRFRPDAASRRARRQELSVDTERVLVFAGKLGPRYLLAETMTFARVLARRCPVRMLVLTHDEPAAFAAAAERGGFDPAALTIRRAAPADVPGWLAAADAGMALIRPTPSERGSSPIKISEYLACGLPVVTTPGIGDISAVVDREAFGSIVVDGSDAACAAAADRLIALWNEGDDVGRRCESWARTWLDVDAIGVERYRRVYEALLSPSIRLRYHATDANV